MCEALVPVAFGLVIGRAVTTGDVGEMVLGAVGILALFAVLAAAGGYGYYFTGRAALSEAHRLRVAVVHRVLKDPAATKGRQAGELLSITSSDTRAATEVISVFGALVAAIMGLGVATAVLIGIDAGLGLGLLAAVVILVTLTQLLGPYLERRLSARQQAVGLAAAVAADLFAGLRSLRGFGGVAEGVRRYRNASRMRKLWSASNVKVYGGGVSEDAFLESLSKLIGDYDRQASSVSSGRGGRSVNQQLHRERILDVADLAAMPKGRAVVLSSGNRPTLIRTQPWMTGPHAEKVKASIAAHDPQASRTIVEAQESVREVAAAVDGNGAA